MWQSSKVSPSTVSPLSLLVATTLCFGIASRASAFGVERLQDVKEAGPSLPQWKLDKIFADTEVKKVTGNIFAWVDLTNKKVHVFSRDKSDTPWDLKNSFRTNPGVKRWDRTTKTRISSTPVGNYQIADQGKYRESIAFDNAPMPFYSRLWDPAQKPSPSQSGIFFHVGKLNDAGSHGCLRLDEEHAKYILANFKKGDKVFVRISK